MAITSRRNLELKVRRSELASARTLLGRHCDAPPEIEDQTDTYFVVPRGRLKLREIAGRDAFLIGYFRPDETAIRQSDYFLTPIPEPVIVRATLGAILGVRNVVHKVRVIYLWRNVRIHLDTVDRLGTFIEFEAIVSEHDNEATSRRNLDELCVVLHIGPEDLLGPSYIDLLENT